MINKNRDEKSYYICGKFESMFEFDQYLGFLMFMGILTIGFWLMIFLISIVPYWLGGSIKELLMELKDKRKAKQQDKLEE